MSSDFFKGFNMRKGFTSPRSFLSTTSTVVVKWKKGGISEYKNISNPWQYITKMKKRMDVENAWLKNE